MQHVYIPHHFHFTDLDPHQVTQICFLCPTKVWQNTGRCDFSCDESYERNIYKLACSAINRGLFLQRYLGSYCNMFDSHRVPHYCGTVTEMILEKVSTTDFRIRYAPTHSDTHRWEKKRSEERLRGGRSSPVYFSTMPLLRSLTLRTKWEQRNHLDTVVESFIRRTHVLVSGLECWRRKCPLRVGVL